jgi:hypothetical protein
MADAQRSRIIHLIIMALVLEAAIFVLGYFGPAMRPLLIWVYPAVALIFVIVIWRARSRHQDDRRHGKRRHPSDT